MKPRAPNGATAWENVYLRKKIPITANLQPRHNSLSMPNFQGFFIQSSKPAGKDDEGSSTITGLVSQEPCFLTTRASDIPQTLFFHNTLRHLAKEFYLLLFGFPQYLKLAKSAIQNGSPQNRDSKLPFSTCVSMRRQEIGGREKMHVQQESEDFMQMTKITR